MALHVRSIGSSCDPAIHVPVDVIDTFDENRWTYDDCDVMVDIDDSHVCSFSIDEEELEHHNNADDQEVSAINSDDHHLDINDDDDNTVWGELLSLLHREQSYHIDAIRVASSPYAFELMKHRSVLNDWRKKICLWSFRVVDHWRYDRQVVLTSMNLLDRYIYMQDQSRGDDRSRNNKDQPPSSSLLSLMTQNEYQLAAMTCLYIAMKMNGGGGSGHHEHGGQHHRSYSLRLSSFVALSRGQFDEDDVCAAERDILHVLQWKVHPIIATDVGMLLLQNLWHRTTMTSSVYHIVEELFSYISELTVIHMGHATTFAWRPLVTAAASILLSMEFITEQALPEHIRSSFRTLLYEAATAAYRRHNNNNMMGFEQYDDIPCTIASLQITLQEALWPELLYLLEEETKNMHHPNNPLAMGHALRIFDMEKVYRYHYHHQHMCSSRCDGMNNVSSTISTSTIATSSSSHESRDGNSSPCEMNRLSTFSPVTTPNASFTNSNSNDLEDDDDDEEESHVSPVTITQCFSHFSRTKHPNYEKGGIY